MCVKSCKIGEKERESEKERKRAPLCRNVPPHMLGLGFRV
jgi:hypothetical protein